MIRSMLHFLLATYLGAKRALVRDQGKKPPSEEKFGSLLLGEIPILIKRIGRPRFFSILMIYLVVVVVGEIVLIDATPGPVLSPRWRIVVAIGLTLLIAAFWLVIHAVRSAGWDPPTRRRTN